MINLDNKLQNGLIFLASDKLNGLGDLACGRRVADLLHKLGGIPAEKIVICSNAKNDFERVFNTDQKYRVISPVEASKLTDIKIQIAAPRLYQESENVITGVPCLYLHEYNHGVQSVRPDIFQYEYQMGLNLCESDNLTKPIGILIDPELHEWSQSQEAKDPVEKAIILTTLPNNFSNAILDGKSPKAFADSSKLYTGYASKELTKQSFLRAMIKLNNQQETDLVFVLPGSFDYASILTKEFLQRKGFGELKVYEGRDGHLEKSHSIQISEQGKTLILLTKEIPNQLMKSLWKASEAECLVTGDQSLTEAISANKVFLYEVLPHKTNVGNELLYWQRLSLYNPGSASVVRAFTALRRDGYSSVYTLNTKIVEEQNANPRILQIVSEILERASTQPKLLDLTKTPIEEFEPAEMIPFDLPVCITLAQVQKVSIRMQDGTSERLDLADSKFDWKSTGVFNFLVTRRKKEEVLV